MEKQPIAYPVKETAASGSYRSAEYLPPKYQGISHVISLHGLKGNTFQFINYHGIVAIVTSQPVLLENDRPSVSKYMLVCDEKDAQTLMQYPERLFRLRCYMHDCGENLHELYEWPAEVLIGSVDEKVEWNSAMESAFQTFINDLAGHRSYYVCDNKQMREKELIKVLYALPARLRAKVSFTVGYCDACCDEKLQLIIRKEGDPPFQGIPSCSYYPGGQKPAHPAAKALRELSERTIQAVSELTTSDEEFLELLAVLYLAERVDDKRAFQKTYPRQVAVLEEAGLCQISKRRNAKRKAIAQSNSEDTEHYRELQGHSNVAGTLFSVVAILALLFAVFWGSHVSKISDMMLYFTFHMTVGQLARYIAVFVAGLCLGLKRRK